MMSYGQTADLLLGFAQGFFLVKKVDESLPLQTDM